MADTASPDDHHPVLENGDPLYLASVARAFHVLSVFKTTSRPLSLEEIATRAGIGRSAAQRIVHTLRQLGYLRKNEHGRGYRPGTPLLEHARDYLRLDPYVVSATPVVLDLRRNAQERVDLSIFDDVRLIFALRLPSKRETFFTTLLGHSVPTFCSAGGRAVLSHLTEEESDSIIARSDRIRLTDKTITDEDAIRQRVRQAKQDGFAFALEEVLTGEVGLAAAVIGPGGRPLGALHIAGSLSEWTPEGFRARFGPLAVEAAHAIGHQL